MAPDPTPTVLRPKHLPSATHDVIAVLETIHVPWDVTQLPDDSLLSAAGKTHEALVYRNTHADEDDVVARICEASVVVGTICRLSGETLRQAPYLKCIVTHAVGTDHIDLEYCRQHNIQVMHTKNVNTETVAEHALALYFSTRRSIVKLHTSLTPGPTTHIEANTSSNEWKTKGSLNAHMRDIDGAPPRTCKQEVAGIIGYGAVGKEIARLCAALGMKVLVSERPSPADASSAASLALSTPPPPAVKASTNNHNHTQQPQRIPFPHLLSQSTILFLALPRTPQTTNLLSTPQLRLVSPTTILINVSRGGIVDERAVLDALVHRRLFGYATDVFAVEPAGGQGESCLLGGPHYYADYEESAEGKENGKEKGTEGEREEKDKVNLVLTPHVAWFSKTTVENSVRVLGENLVAYAKGDEECDNIVIPRRF